MNANFDIDKELANLFLTCSHEAAHAVLLYHSDYHEVAGDIRIELTTRGSTGIRVSARKLQAVQNGRGAKPTAKELAIDEAVVLYGGHLGEERFAKAQEKKGEALHIGRQGSKLDVKMAEFALRKAGVGRWGKLIARVTAWWRVRKYWPQIDALVDQIMKRPNYQLGREAIDTFLASYRPQVNTSTIPKQGV